MTTGTPGAETSSRSATRRRLFRFGLAAVVLAALAIGGFIWWFLRDDSPEAVSLATAAQVLQNDDDAAAATTEPVAPDDEPVSGTDGDEATATTAAPVTEAPPAESAIEGTWTVDTSLGEFSFEDSTGSFVGFRVEEELSSIGSTTAVGRAPNVSGTIAIEGNTLVEAVIEADMSTITTNDRRRDDRVKDALDTDQFPTASFELIAPIDLGEGAAAGEPVEAEAVGTLTVHGISNEVTFALQAQLIDGVVVVVGSTDIEFADFDVEVPTAPIVLSADDFGIVEFQLLMTR